MDRMMVYPGALPLETDLLNTNKYAMIALSKLAAAIFGTGTVVSGLACTPTSPASMQVQVGPGEIYSLVNVDGTAYSSLAADTTHSILKQGILMDAVTLSCPAPGTAGQSINYLVEATYQDVDGDAQVLTYYNASNPSQAWSGPNNDGQAQNTVRKGVCTVQVKAGVAAATGSQTTPAVDSGYVPLFVVTVAYGATTITAPNIATASGAPILSETLLQKISQATADARYYQKGSAIDGSPIGQTTPAAVAATVLKATQQPAGTKVLVIDRSSADVTALWSELDSLDNIYLKTSNGDLIFHTKWDNVNNVSLETIRFKADGTVDASGALSAAAGTAGNEVVNFSQFASLLGTSGYQKLPTGEIIQWGTLPTVSVSANGNTSNATNFPIAFPTKCTACIGVAASGACFVTSNPTTTSTGTTLNSANSWTGSVGGFFIAVGY